MQKKLRNQVTVRMSLRWGRGAAGTIACLAITGTAAAQEDATAEEGATADGESASASAGFSLGGESESSATAASSADQPQSSSSEAAPATQVPSYAGARARRTELSLSERYSEIPYMQRYKPEAGLWEVGMFGGLLFPSPDHNLKVAFLPREEFSSVAGQLGGHVAFYPLSFLGVELEGMGAGGSTKTTELSSVFYGLRAHAIVQLPYYSVVPFALIGAGTLGAVTETMGHDRDGAFHFGAGVKVPFNHRVSGRFDVRDNLTQKGERAANGRQTHHPAVHLGVTFTFERTPPPLPTDRDYDGLYDVEDRCPDQGALTVEGCPADSDGDGILDPVDECPAVAGTEPTGCPNLDADGDGVPIPVDECPDQMASTPNGCPDQDLDGDGILGDADKCPKMPETRNGFEDDDGCPDEMPDAIRQFTGVIQGINFRQGTADIEATSFPILDSAVEILAKYPSIKIEVSGHTSSEGTQARNDELSIQRAEAVRSYFTSKSIDGDRITARGAGSTEPVADNATEEGRKKNRRIEFRVLSQP